MNTLKSNSHLIILFALSIFTFSCKDDDNGTVTPITIGSSVVINNTFQSDGFTSGTELPVEQLFELDEGALFATSSVTSDTEFPAYLLGLYDVDISENSITYELVAGTDDPTYGALYRVLEPGTFDRYYLNFATPQNVTGFTSDNSSVNLRIDSNTSLVVEIGEGFDFRPGATFTITLN
ncbi:MAG: hypothetical protein AAGA66_04975 [Bacteroidota bacterium]